MLFRSGLVALRRRLRTLALVADPLVRQMLAYMLLLGLIQLSVRTGRLAPISFRLADLVGVFLLLSFLAWIQRQQAAWAVLPPLAITLIGWLNHRLLDAAALRCGLDDSFLCIPDRWPWLIHYG